MAHFGKTCLSLKQGQLIAHQFLSMNQCKVRVFSRYCVFRETKLLLRKLHIQRFRTDLNDTKQSNACHTKPHSQTTNSNRSEKYIRHRIYNHRHFSCGKIIDPLVEAKVSNQIAKFRPVVRPYSDDVSLSQFSIENTLYAAFLDALVKEYSLLRNNESSGSKGSQVSRQNFLRAVVPTIEKLQAKHKEKQELETLLQDESDPEMQKMMRSEASNYNAELEEIQEELVDLLVGSDPADDSDIKLEVTAGVGGQEAMLFCQEVFNMYCNYATRKGWQLVNPTSDDSEMGGARRASVEVSGDSVHWALKHEAGVHRVQRVPRTEKAGRVHTSTITVSVTPLPKQIDINLETRDLKVETFRNSGPGGQSVNTTDSAVRITHIPTGTVAEAKEERSQMKNKEIAMKKLRQRIYESVLSAQQAEIRAVRQLQQGTRARSEKIRTYNFPQDRVTDHRTRDSTANLANLLAVGGDGLDGLIEGLMARERRTTLSAMVEAWKAQGAA